MFELLALAAALSLSAAGVAGLYKVTQPHNHLQRLAQRFDLRMKDNRASRDNLTLEIEHVGDGRTRTAVLILTLRPSWLPFGLRLTTRQTGAAGIPSTNKTGDRDFDQAFSWVGDSRVLTAERRHWMLWFYKHANGLEIADGVIRAQADFGLGLWHDGNRLARCVQWARNLNSDEAVTLRSLGQLGAPGWVGRQARFVESAWTAVAGLLMLLVPAVCWPDTPALWLGRVSACLWFTGSFFVRRSPAQARFAVHLAMALTLATVMFALPAQYQYAEALNSTRTNGPVSVLMLVLITLAGCAFAFSRAESWVALPAADESVDDEMLPVRLPRGPH